MWTLTLRILRSNVVPTLAFRSPGLAPLTLRDSNPIHQCTSPAAHKKRSKDALWGLDQSIGFGPNLLCEPVCKRGLSRRSVVRVCEWGTNSCSWSSVYISLSSMRSWTAKTTHCVTVRIASDGGSEGKFVDGSGWFSPALCTNTDVMMSSFRQHLYKIVSKKARQIKKD